MMGDLHTYRQRGKIENCGWEKNHKRCERTLVDSLHVITFFSPFSRSLHPFLSQFQYYFLVLPPFFLASFFSSFPLSLFPLSLEYSLSALFNCLLLLDLGFPRTVYTISLNVCSFRIHPPRLHLLWMKGSLTMSELGCSMQQP